ncbi:MAG TPA: SnoaL-like domain-containing protein [Chryseosolibacter sp.]
MTATTSLTTADVAARFHHLAQQEKWFEIQDELFADHVKSVEPAQSPYFKNAEGKSAVRKKGEAFVSRIKAVHKLYTSSAIVSANHFAVVRETDVTVEGFGRINISQIMVYHVDNGKIVLEQFFY